MSGIFGLLRFDGGTVASSELEAMAEAMAHRAPDGRNCKVLGSVGLGHCLMRVNVEDRFEAQPLSDPETGVTLVADCRIDNRAELAACFGLGPADTANIPDSAFVLGAYKKWGDDSAAHLLGDFTFAIWDGRAGKLLLARDHMGQRPVYYYAGKDFFAFATEIKALWAIAEVPRKISEIQLGKHLLHDARSREGASYFEDIWNVVGGAVEIVTANGARRSRRYWEAHPAQEHLGRDEDYYIETYRRVFRNAVECRINRLIHPPALSLSAGFDSGGIAGLCGSTLQAQGRKLTAVSSIVAKGYEGPLHCPWRWVEACRRHMPHLDVHYIESGEVGILDDIERSFATEDGFLANGHSVIGELYRTAAGAGARLMMSGIGGDEALNRRGQDFLPYLIRTRQFRRFIAEYKAFLRISGASGHRMLRRIVVSEFTPGPLRRMIAAARRTFGPKEIPVPVAQDFAAALRRRGITFSVRSPAAIRDGARGAILQALRNWATQNCRQHANQAARHGLDLTFPLLDKRVVEFGLAIPPDLETRDGRNRFLARRSLGEIYPPEFQTRGRRQDHLVPDVINAIQRSRLQLLSETARLTSEPILRRYFDFEKMQRTLSRSPDTAEQKMKLALSVHALLAAMYMARSSCRTYRDPHCG